MSEEEKRLVPKISVLNRVLEKLSDQDGFDFNLLEKGPVVSVKTKDIDFSFRVLDPFECTVYIWGDYKHFINPKEARFSGSKFHPATTMIKLKWIGLDMSLEFWFNDDEGKIRYVATSVTEEISVEGHVVLPKQDFPVN